MLSILSASHSFVLLSIKYQSCLSVQAICSQFCWVLSITIAYPTITRVSIAFPVPWVSSKTNHRFRSQACWVWNFNRVSDNSLSIKSIRPALSLAASSGLLCMEYRSCDQILEYQSCLRFLEYWVDPNSASTHKIVEYQKLITSWLMQRSRCLNSRLIVSSNC